MIHPYEWADYRLIVTVRNRVAAANYFLLDQMSMTDFIEHWLSLWEEERDQVIHEMTVTSITSDVYDLLAPVYPPERVLEG